MAEKNSKLKFDDYTRRLTIPSKEKREQFCRLNSVTLSYMYRILSPQRFDARYTEKRERQDQLRYIAWKEYGALFENVSYTRN